MFAFDNTYARELAGAYVAWAPATPPRPALVALNAPLAEELGLDVAALQEHGARWLSGAQVPEGAEPIAQAYAGHQFGGLSPLLGDGRALLLGELVDRHGRRRDLHLKGSGRTPFSRGGDGRAALGPMLREYVVGEALHALGVPTSRALAVSTTGDEIVRDRRLPGAVLARVAASHLRVGTFELFALRGDRDALARLVTYALRRHAPDASDAPEALALLLAVRDAQARLVARWMGLGFIHGVLNTDNVTISGESLDFGPCAWMEAHDEDAVFSSIDTHGRYAYGNQPAITGWNLARFASALLPLIDPDEARAVRLAQDALDGFAPAYQAAWATTLRAKVGLATVHPDDGPLLAELQALLGALAPDHTAFFRALGAAAIGDTDALVTPLQRREQPVSPAELDRLHAWLGRWRARLAAEGDPALTAARLQQVNPRVVPRNHQVEAALSAATAGDLAPLHRLVDAVRQPFSDDPALDPYAEPATASFTRRYQTFCGT